MELLPIRIRRPNLACATSTLLTRSQAVRVWRPPRSKTWNAESVTATSAMPL